MTTQSIIGHSPELDHILRTLPMIALSDVSVLITGETGVGKELIAHTVHAQSRRADKPMITINCAALPAEDVVVDLFGRCDESGNIVSRGRLLAAEGSTVFLDEVDALPMSVQAQILRFLEAGECQLQGSHQVHVADVRIMAASSADLSAAVKANTFRADLYYRLLVVPVELPPLLKRREDVAPLLKHYTQVFARGNAVVRFSKQALQTLEHYPWPGNVRELENFCQHMALLSPGKLLELEDLPALMQPTHNESEVSFTLPPTGIDLAELELDLIQQALEMTNGNRSKAARLLGISRDTLLYRMQKYNLTD